MRLLPKICFQSKEREGPRVCRSVGRSVVGSGSASTSNSGSDSRSGSGHVRGDGDGDEEMGGLALMIAG